MKVVYITGLAHSGSTLLGLLIGTHSRVTNIGEISCLRGFAQPDRSEGPGSLRYACTCGAVIASECLFWQHVNKSIHIAAGRTLADLDVNSSDDATFRRDNIRLFDAIVEVSGSDVLVDSSKVPGRLEKLMNIPDLEVIPIHLVRGATGQVHSMRKKHGGLGRHILAYNRVTWRIYRLLSKRYHVVVHYERLATDVRRELGMVMKGMGLEFESSQLQWTHHVHHDIGGNRMRFRRDSSVELDRSHESGLGRASRTLIDICSLPSRRLIGENNRWLDPCQG